MPSDDAAHPLPPPPEALLEALRRAEHRLDELDDLRREVRLLREALEERPLPTAEEVHGRLMSVTMADPVGITDSVTAELTPEHPTGEAHIAAEVTITATGEVGTVETAAVRSWLDQVQRVGQAASPIVTIVLKVWQALGYPPFNH